MRRAVLSTPADTHRVGAALGRVVPPGAVLALIGDLGAGKTALVRGLAEGMATEGLIQSPTYVLTQIHPRGRLPLWHVDLYRLGGVEELSDLGLDAADPRAVVAIEWADRFPEVLPDDHLEIRLADHRSGGRTITLHATGPRHADLEAVLTPEPS